MWLRRVSWVMLGFILGAAYLTAFVNMPESRWCERCGYGAEVQSE